jgi:hypothetical protein
MTGLFGGNVSTLSVKNQVLSLVSFYQKNKTKSKKLKSKNEKIRILFGMEDTFPKHL